MPPLVKKTPESARAGVVGEGLAYRQGNRIAARIRPEDLGCHPIPSGLAAPETGPGGQVRRAAGFLNAVELP